MSRLDCFLHVMDNSFTRFVLELIGDMTTEIYVLLVFIAADYLTHRFLLQRKSGQPPELRRGFILKRVMLFVIIGVARAVDMLTNMDFLRDIAVYYFISYEGISIVNASAKLGLPVPERLAAALRSLAGKGANGSGGAADAEAANGIGPQNGAEAGE